MQRTTTTSPPITEDLALRVGELWIAPPRRAKRDAAASPAVRRVYITVPPERVGLVVDRYRSGGISSATLDGERIGNRDAAAIIAAMTHVDIWWDAGDELLHTADLMSEHTARDHAWLVAEMTAAAHAMLTDAAQEQS